MVLTIGIVCGIAIHEHERSESQNNEVVPIEREQDPARKAERLHDVLKEHGVETEVVEIPGNTEFPHAIIFPHKYDGDEPLVRVYRGIGQLDETLLEQASYALRTREGAREGQIRVMDHARQAVDALTERPTYKNFIAYLDAVWPDLTDKEVGSLERELKQIEDNTLSGFPLRTNLVHATYAFNGRKIDSGIAPYISASPNALEAAAYGEAGVMVLDVPLSKIDALGANGKGEVVIKGAIPVEYIAAVLPRENYGEGASKETVQANIDLACTTIDAMQNHAVLDRMGMKEVYTEIRAKDVAWDTARHDQDVHDIRERRASLLRSRLADVGIRDADIDRIVRDEATDRYTATQRGLYDKLIDQFIQAGGDPNDFKDYYSYDTRIDRDTYASVNLYCHRDAVNDEMLKYMRAIVRRREELNEMRRKTREDALRAEQLRGSLDRDAV